LRERERERREKLRLYSQSFLSKIGGSFMV
jgi:hypothetical protein